MVKSLDAKSVTTFSHSSEVPSPIDEVWRFVTSATGINYELMPVMRMTVPQSFKDKSIQDVSPGEYLGRSWFLLGGLVPFDYSKITVAEIDPGERFLERSTLGSMRHWQHERKLESIGGNRTRITDSLEFLLRFPAPGTARVTGSILRLLFRHRHRKLAKRFGQQGS